MNRIALGFTTLTLFGAIGCGAPPTPGGPGATGVNTHRSLTGTKDDTFTLSGPLLATKITQGEAKNVSISISRGKNFQEDVVLVLENLPKGVTIEGEKPQIKSSTNDATFTLKAADDAAVGEFIVKVSGRPTKGNNATSEFKITIDEKKK